MFTYTLFYESIRAEFEGVLMLKEPPIPTDWKGLSIVGSFEDVINTRLSDETNFALFPRDLMAEFNGVDFSGLALYLVKKCNLQDGDLYQVPRHDELQWLTERLIDDRRKAADLILSDMKMLRFYGVKYPMLRIITSGSYQDRGTGGQNIYDPHSDGPDRLMISYSACGTQIFQSENKSYNPEKSFHAGLGCVWRQAGRSLHEQNPLFHRAPTIKEGDLPRLLLVAEYAYNIDDVGPANLWCL